MVAKQQNELVNTLKAGHLILAVVGIFLTIGVTWGVTTANVGSNRMQIACNKTAISEVKEDMKDTRETMIESLTRIETHLGIKAKKKQ